MFRDAPGRARSAAARAVCAATALAIASPAAAQTYDVPSFQSPYGEEGIGLYLIAQNDLDDLGVLVTWRRQGRGLDLGLRGGLVDAGDDLALFGGIELKDELVRASDDFPLDAAWVSGAGLGLVTDADVAIVRIPFGVTLGRAIQEGSTRFTPYVHPRVALDIVFRDDGPGPGDGDSSDADLNVDVDLGLDIGLGGGLRALRFAVTLGHNEAIGVGLLF